MSQNTTGASSTENTAALITSSIAVGSHVVNDLLDGLLRAISSNEAGNQEVDNPLGLIRNELDTMALTRGEEEENIKSLLKSVLEKEVQEHLEKEIEKQINECVDKMVAELAESYINEHVPKPLRDSADKGRSELMAVHIQLHNIEARRQNSTIKSTNEPLHHLLKEDGAKSRLSPTSISTLSELNDRELSELVRFYGKNDLGKKSRSDNVNWFLQFSGVAFQYVRG